MAPLKEEIVVNVMERYLKAKHYHSGPDFHAAGKAYEAKGSDSDFADTLDQLSDYAFSGKYTEVNAVFPVDFLASAYKIQVFHLFCRILEKPLNRTWDCSSSGLQTKEISP